MAYITFDDGTGVTTVQSAWPAPGNQFQNEQPSDRPVGESARALGDGYLYMWQFRRDYGTHVEIQGIADADKDDAERLLSHMRSGGLCSLATEDTQSNIFSECQLAPNDDGRGFRDPELTQEFRDERVWRLSMSVISVAASPAPIIFEY